MFSKPLVATGGVEKKICVYSLNDKKELLSHKDLPSVPSCLAFDRDDISLVNGAENGQIQIWDLKSQTTKPRTLSGHRAQVTTLVLKVQKVDLEKFLISDILIWFFIWNIYNKYIII